MESSVERHGRLLDLYYLTAHVVGWVLLAAVPLVLLNFASWYVRHSADWKSLLQYLLSSVVDVLFIGLLVLGVAQFIRYLSEAQYQPGWILRNGDKILCAFAALIAIEAVIINWSAIPYIGGRGFFELGTNIFELVVSTLLTAAKILVLVGLAHALRASNKKTLPRFGSMR